jgi:Icc-related predicted phosphoesterase
VIRVAAVGDIHLGPECTGQLRPGLEGLADHADLLLLAGDLTRCGEPAEIDVVCGELADVTVPVVAVLGNHDHHAGQAAENARRLGEAGIHVLEGTSVVLDVEGVSVGVAGTKGFGGGFVGASGSAFGEDEMKAFIAYTVRLADGLRDALAVLPTDVRLALLHYSPIDETLRGERLEIYPFLGSYLLAEAIDDAGCDVAFHGHAHHGTERGVTAGGTRVRNVAQPVLARPYRVYGIEPRPEAWSAAAALAEAV